MNISKLILTVTFLLLIVISFSPIAQDKYLDLTQNKINTLSQNSKQLLSQLDDTLSIQAYAPNVNVLNNYNILLQQYSKASKLVKTQVHQTESGELIVIEYKNLQKTLTLNSSTLSEQMLSDLIHKLVGYTPGTQLEFVIKRTAPKDASYQRTSWNSFLYHYGFTLIFPLILVCVGRFFGEDHGV
jgi:hypothetical protein